jgi:hypothetical protein
LLDEEAREIETPGRVGRIGHRLEPRFCRPAAAAATTTAATTSDGGDN